MTVNGRPGWGKARVALALAAAVLVAGCESPPKGPGDPSGPGAVPTGAAERGVPSIVLTDPKRPRLTLTLSLDGDDLPRPGRFEFKDLGCGGTYRYAQKDAAGHLVLQMDMRPGRCLKGCQLVVSPDFRSYVEVCNGRRALAGAFEPPASLDAARDPADIARREAMRQRELAALRAEAEQASTPAGIERVRRKLQSRDEPTERLLDARLSAFQAQEREALITLPLAELRSFIADRSAASEDPKRAASESGLKLAAEELQKRYLQAAAVASIPDLEALIRNPDIGEPARRAMAARLGGHYQQQRAFLPLFRLYELTADREHLKAGAPFARSAAELALVEGAAVKALHTPGWLFDVQPSVTVGRPSSAVAENRGLFANFTAHVSVPVGAEVIVKPRAGGPLKLSRNRYQVTVTAVLTVPRVEQLRSHVLGDKDRTDTVTRTVTAQMTLGPPSYEARVPLSFGSVNLGYFQSGSQGGYTATYPSDEGRISVRVTSIELLP